MEVLIQNAEKDIANLQSTLKKKDLEAVAKSLTFAQSSVAAALEAIETFGDHLLTEKKIEEFQLEKAAQRNLHKIFFFLQYDAERFLVAAKSKGKRETRPRGGDNGHEVVINQGSGLTPTTTCQNDDEILPQEKEENPEKKEFEHGDDGAKQFPSSNSTVKDKTESGGGSRGNEDRVNKRPAPRDNDEEKKRECEQDDGAKQFPSSNAATKDETDSGGGPEVVSSQGSGPTPTPTCQNDDELALQQKEEETPEKQEYEHECDDDDAKFSSSIPTARDEPPPRGGVQKCEHEDDDDGVKQFPSSATTRDEPPSGDSATTFENPLQFPEPIQFNPHLMTGQLEKEKEKPAVRVQPDAHSHPHNKKNALPKEPSEFEKGGNVGGKLPPHFSTAKTKEPPPGGGATKYENTGGGKRGDGTANKKTGSAPTAATLNNREKDKCGWCSKLHHKTVCQDPQGQEEGMKNDDDAKQPSRSTASGGVNPQPGDAVENPDVPLVEFLQRVQFLKNRDEVVAYQQYGGTTTQQQHHEVVKSCASSAKKLLDPQWWKGPLCLYSPPTQPLDTVGDTVGARKEAQKKMRKSVATIMVANQHRSMETRNLKDGEIATYPIILPDDDDWVERRVLYLHEEASHFGTQIILGKNRERFWLLSKQRAAKKIVIASWTHRQLNARRMEVAESPLPITRTRTGVPYNVVGVGNASPLRLKNKMRSSHREELELLLLKVEVLNNCPLTYLKENLTTLPPTLIVVVRNSGLSLFLEMDTGDAFGVPAAHRRQQREKEELYSRFRREYLAQLYGSKMKTPREAAEPGEAVLVEIENEKWPGWPVEAIVEANPGKDCATWINKVKTRAGIATRPTQIRIPTG